MSSQQEKQNSIGKSMDQDAIDDIDVPVTTEV
jgi:hypothetical protein